MCGRLSIRTGYARSRESAVVAFLRASEGSARAHAIHMSVRWVRQRQCGILLCSSWPGKSCVSKVFWSDGLNQTTCKGRTQHASSSQYDAQAAQHAYVIVHPLLGRGHMRWHVAIAARTRRATTLASAHRLWGAACAHAQTSEHPRTATTQTARQACEARPNARVEICRRASAV